MDRLQHLDYIIHLVNKAFEVKPENDQKGQNQPEKARFNDAKVLLTPEDIIRRQNDRISGRKV